MSYCQIRKLFLRKVLGLIWPIWPNFVFLVLFFIIFNKKIYLTIVAITIKTGLLSRKSWKTKNGKILGQIVKKAWVRLFFIWPIWPRKIPNQKWPKSHSDTQNCNSLWNRPQTFTLHKKFTYNYFNIFRRRDFRNFSAKLFQKLFFTHNSLIFRYIVKWFTNYLFLCYNSNVWNELFSEAHRRLLSDLVNDMM